MSVTLEQVGALLELIAPISFAEEWDNSGFNVNLHNTDTVSYTHLNRDRLPGRRVLQPCEGGRRR